MSDDFEVEGKVFRSNPNIQLHHVWPFQRECEKSSIRITELVQDEPLQLKKLLFFF